MTTYASNLTTKQWIEALQPKTKSKLRSGLEAALTPTTELSVLDVATIDLADRLQLPNSPEGQYVWGRLSAEIRGQITGDQDKLGGDLSDFSVDWLVKELNGIIQGPPIWKETAFLKTDCRISTRKLCERGERAKANRALIEDTFPGCITRAGAYAVPMEYHLAEKKALKTLDDKVRAKWERLLLDPAFQTTLETEKRGEAKQVCQRRFGLQPPAVFKMQVWCEMRAGTGDGKRLLTILSSTSFLWKGRPGIDLDPADKGAQLEKIGGPAKTRANLKVSQLDFLQHHVRRELRRGKAAALLLSYFETLQVPHVELMKEFGFSNSALKALSIVGELMAKDAKHLLADHPQHTTTIKNGRGRPPEESAFDKARRFFDLAMQYPDAKARALILKTGKKFDSTEEYRANAMIGLAKATRRHLPSVRS